MFTDEQAFEFFADSSSDIPVASDFLSNIIKKVAPETIDNPFMQHILRIKQVELALRIL